MVLSIYILYIFQQIEEEVTEKPVNTLAEEEEYERRQEQLRKEQEEAAQGSQSEYIPISA